VQVAEKLPSSPHILSELQTLLNNPDNGVEEVAVLLRQDQGLTARVVRIANSIVFNRGEAVGSLEESLGRIGYAEVHRMAGAAVLRQLSSIEFSFYPISKIEFSRNSLLVAFLMEEIGSHSGTNPQVAYTAGLLRSIGKLVIDTVARTDFRGRQAPPIGEEGLLAWEQKFFGITHSEVASAVLRAWRFPVEVFVPVRDHLLHRLAVDPLPSCKMLHLAAATADKRGWGLPGESIYWGAADAIQEELRLSPQDLAEILERAEGQCERVLSALGDTKASPAAAAS
jgi:HD-like signal output (HDOD) protein